MRILLIKSLFFSFVPVDTEIDDSSLHTDSSVAETDIMSPDSNHNVQLSCNESATAIFTTTKMGRLRNGSIEDDQQKAVREAIEAMESIKVVNGLRHLDDSFDNDSQDDQSSSQKCYSADTPSSDLVIDERSVDDHYMEQSDSPDLSESFNKSTDDVESSSDNGEWS